ncbi:Arginine biosynthesis bifunctional protein ArgJ [Labeo rohita]|uniref:Arginine biosynthesis bifunctional protein ArgJ n=1 Tax=Labeo rohita TaxID=84645 RepID=A0ABQ8LJI1_LABRO|nr:Arginine biosynthesis bifunctional protein ArgJ [Labeo rohita]
MCWSALTTQRLWHTLTTRTVYATFTCHSSPAISCPRTSTDPGFCAPLTFRVTGSPRGEWRLHPQMVRLFWSRFSQAQVDLLPHQSPLIASGGTA